MKYKNIIVIATVAIFATTSTIYGANKPKTSKPELVEGIVIGQQGSKILKVNVLNDFGEPSGLVVNVKAKNAVSSTQQIKIQFSATKDKYGIVNGGKGVKPVPVFAEVLYSVNNKTTVKDNNGGTSFEIPGTYPSNAFINVLPNSNDQNKAKAVGNVRSTPIYDGDGNLTGHINQNKVPAKK